MLVYCLEHSLPAKFRTGRIPSCQVKKSRQRSDTAVGYFGLGENVQLVSRKEDGSVVNDH